MRFMDKFSAILVIVAFVVFVISIVFQAGIDTGARAHFTGKIVCEILLDKQIRCIPSKTIKVDK